jgi:hypothetical protein
MAMRGFKNGFKRRKSRHLSLSRFSLATFGPNLKELRNAPRRGETARKRLITVL